MLTPSQQTRVAAALEVANRNAAQAAGLEPGYVSGAWAWVIDAESSSAALRTNARATEALAFELTAKAERWRSSATPVEDVEVRDFEQAAGTSSNEASLRTAELLTPTEALRETAGPILDPAAWPPWLRTAATWGLVLVVVAILLPTLLGALVRGRR